MKSINNLLWRGVFSEYVKNKNKGRIRRWIIASIVVIGLLCVMAWLDSDKDELQTAHEHTVETIRSAK